MLGLLSQDADIAEIEAVFKQEPVLTFNLLRLTNSAGSGMATRITSLGHAIILLGRRQLLRWLQLLLYSSAPGSPHTVNPLLQLAATRGRLMALLADRAPADGDAGSDFLDQAFMTGILSLMPALVGGNIEDVLSQVSLVKEVHEALAKRSGNLGDLLRLVEALEEDGSACVPEYLLRLPGIDIAYANACLAKALTWANNLARESA